MDKDDVNDGQNLEEWLNQVHFGGCCSDDDCEDETQYANSETEENQEPQDSQ